MTEEEKVKFLKQRTQEYKSRLRSLYCAKIKLTDPRDYCGSRFLLEHHCLTCGSDFVSLSTRMMRGRGCKVCNSEAGILQALEKYKLELRTTYSNVMELWTKRTSKFSLDKSYRHRCTTCGDTCNITPREVTADNIACPVCKDDAAKNPKNVAYRDHLHRLYGQGVVRCTSKSVFLTRPIKHRCRICNISWSDTVANMLQKQSVLGCTHTLVDEPADFPQVRYFGVTYVLRTGAEVEALPKVLKKIPAGSLRTALEYPIPVIRYGKSETDRFKHVPGFMSKDGSLYVDAVTRAAFENYSERWTRIARAAAAQNIVHRILIVRADNRVTALPANWYDPDRLVKARQGA